MAALAGCATTGDLRPNGPEAPRANWVERVVPNTPLTIRMPLDIEERNQLGCYSDPNARALYGPGWRHFCVGLASGDDPPMGFEAITQQSRASDCIDCMIYEEVSVERMRLGPHDAEVQLGIASGGLGHKKRRPELLVTFPTRGGELVVVHGEFGDARDAALILGIAGTVARAESNDR